MIIFICVLCVQLKAQDKTIDSLKIELKNAKHDTSRCNILSILAETADDDEWPMFNEKLYNLTLSNLSTSSGNSFYLKHKASAINNKGVLAQIQGDIEKALNYFNEALLIYKKLGKKDVVASSYNNIGSIYFNLGENAKALDYFQTSLKIHQELNNKLGIAGCYNNIGFQLAHQGNIQKAIEYFNNSLAI